MPYVEESRRRMMNNLVREMWALQNNLMPGDLNYLFSRLATMYLKNGCQYSKINDVIGALECAKMELYRRLAAPYEDVKMKDNGDVYS